MLTKFDKEAIIMKAAAKFSVTVMAFHAPVLTTSNNTRPHMS